jgi:Leu/Phe-tRNA-protein transferase
MSTTHLASLGAREISRASFVRRVRELVREPATASPWTLDPDLAGL